MKKFSADDLVSHKWDFPSEEVEIPGGTVTVKGMNAGELLAFCNAAAKGKGDEEVFPLKLVAASVLGSVDRYKEVANWPGSVVNKLSSVAMRINGLIPPGNSEATGGEGFSSD
jgi:hypothetical protein